MSKISMHGGGGGTIANTKPKYPLVTNFDIFYFVISILNLCFCKNIFYVISH